MLEIMTKSIKTIENQVERDLDSENKTNDGWMRWRQTGLQIITQQDDYCMVCKNITIVGDVCTFERVDE